MTPNKLNYRLAVRGLFGRNRTAKFDLFDLALRVDIDFPKFLEELRPLVRDKLNEIRAKTGCRYFLREEPVEYDGKTECFELMSERILLKGVVGGEETMPDLPRSA